MYQSEIHNFINSFALSRSEMDGVKLMNRVETKYVFCSNRLPELLNLVNLNYRVLEIDDIRFFPYCTTYLDTSDFFFIHNRYEVNSPGIKSDTDVMNLPECRIWK